MDYMTVKRSLEMLEYLGLVDSTEESQHFRYYRLSPDGKELITVLKRMEKKGSGGKMPPNSDKSIPLEAIDL